MLLCAFIRLHVYLYQGIFVYVCLCLCMHVYAGVLMFVYVYACVLLHMLIYMYEKNGEHKGSEGETTVRGRETG